MLLQLQGGSMKLHLSSCQLSQYSFVNRVRDLKILPLYSLVNYTESNGEPQQKHRSFQYYRNDDPAGRINYATWGENDGRVYAGND